MKTVTTLGIDLAKLVFQLHGVDARGKVVFKKKLSRVQLSEFMMGLPACVVAMEACASAHFWARQFQSMGHTIKLISPQFVKPFVKSNKNDANDAEAIVEAALRPSMRFVAVKTQLQQEALAIHRVRERLVRSRTALVNEMRGLLGEYGLVFPQGIHKFKKAVRETIENSMVIGSALRRLFLSMLEELRELDERIGQLEIAIEQDVKSNAVAKRLMTIPGVGPITASAMTASVGDPRVFASGRELSGWLGVVPRQCSSGGKSKLGGISKRGDKYLRRLLIHGARAVLTRRKTVESDWLSRVRERRGFNRACVALANKNARVIWALMTTESTYEQRVY